ncbi:MAG: hypothetical protein O3B75_00330 [Planctomycetota bacterium]|nr:hypothetical protein [Planctomycetota bacterium]
MKHFTFRSVKIICISCILVSAQSQAFAQSVTPKTSPAKDTAKPEGKTSATASTTASTIVNPVEKKKRQVFVLPLDGMVGIGLRHDEMEQVEKIADSFGPGQVIILRINSNGGLVIEGDWIGASLTRIKAKHRLVAWIEKAISGGAFTGLFCDEMYFMPEAALGSITMLSGATRQEISEVREDWKTRVADACAAGDRDPLIGPAMVHSEMELSYEKVGDKVTFYPDAKHTYVLSRKGENLDFSAQSAEHSGFSDGTAATEKDLFLELGVDDPTKFEVNPAGKQIAEKWQKTISSCKQEVPLLLQKRDIEGRSQGGVPFLQARIRNTQKIVDWFKKCPPEMKYDLQIGEEAIEQLKDEIVQMRKQIKEMQAARQPGA